MAEEVEEELEAFEAVYGEDCTILQRSPPYVTVALKPATAADISLQFVEAALVIEANDQYPAMAPAFDLRDTKGLDDKRHAKLLSDLHAQVSELSPGPMLVAIAEAAKDLLTSMNVPDGDCCFCMLPLVFPDSQSGTRPFMKLMSCFHCFHSKCFGEWWRWLHSRSSAGEDDRVSVASSLGRNLEEAGETPVVQCPVCRCVVHPNDIARVREYLMSDTSRDKDKSDEDTLEVPEVLHTDVEIARRARFAAEFEAQKVRGGIIEPKKLEVILPGMVLPPNPILQPPEEPEIQPSSTTPASESPSNDSSQGPTHVATSTSYTGEQPNRGRSGGHERHFSRRPGPPRGKKEHRNMSRRNQTAPSEQGDFESRQAVTTQESHSLPRSMSSEEFSELSRGNVARGPAPGSVSVASEEAADHGATPRSLRISGGRDGRGSVWGDGFRGNGRGRPGRGRHRGGHGGDQAHWKPMDSSSDTSVGRTEGQDWSIKGGTTDSVL